MRVRKGIGILFLGVIGLGSVLAVFGVAYILHLQGDQEIRRQVTEVEFVSLKAATQSYHRKVGTYRGVCMGIGVPSGFICNESDGSFAIAVEQSIDSVYCIDSAGFAGHISSLKVGTSLCTN